MLCHITLGKQEEVNLVAEKAAGVDLDLRQDLNQICVWKNIKLNRIFCIYVSAIKALTPLKHLEIFQLKFMSCLQSFRLQENNTNVINKKHRTSLYPDRGLYSHRSVYKYLNHSYICMCSLSVFPDVW